MRLYVTARQFLQFIKAGPAKAMWAPAVPEAPAS
jgi:hypothetical protein